jgi:hypothetical protein
MVGIDRTVTQCRFPADNISPITVINATNRMSTLIAETIVIVADSAQHTAELLIEAWRSAS